MPYLISLSDLVATWLWKVVALITPHPVDKRHRATVNFDQLTLSIRFNLIQWDPQMPTFPQKEMNPRSLGFSLCLQHPILATNPFPLRRVLTVLVFISTHTKRLLRLVCIWRNVRLLSSEIPTMFFFRSTSSYSFFLFSRGSSQFKSARPTSIPKSIPITFEARERGINCAKK